MENDTEQAQGYADVIAQEVSELEAALIAVGAYVNSEADEAPQFDGQAFEDTSDVISYFANFLALEISELTRVSYYAGGSTRVRSSVEITRTLGGPAAFVRFDGEGSAAIRVYWGTREATRTVYAPNLDAELWALMDALSDVAKAY